MRANVSDPSSSTSSNHHQRRDRSTSPARRRKERAPWKQDFQKWSTTQQQPSQGKPREEVLVGRNIGVIATTCSTSNSTALSSVTNSIRSFTPRPRKSAAVGETSNNNNHSQQKHYPYGNYSYNTNKAVVSPADTITTVATNASTLTPISTRTDASSPPSVLVGSASVNADSAAVDGECPIPLRFLETIQEAFASTATCCGSAGEKHDEGNNTTPVVNLYSDILHVLPTAKDHELRIAYYRRGRQVLASDAGIGTELSPFAKQKFQAVSMTYEILSTPAYKAYYDEYGMQACLDFYYKNKKNASSSPEPGQPQENKAEANNTTPATTTRTARSSPSSSSKQHVQEQEKEGDACSTLSDPSPAQCYSTTPNGVNDDGRNDNNPILRTKDSSRRSSSCGRTSTCHCQQHCQQHCSSSSGHLEASNNNNRIRWNEQVEELVYDQDPEETRFKSKKKSLSSRHTNSTNGVSASDVAIMIGEPPVTVSNNNTKKNNQTRVTKVKHKVILEAQELGAHLDQIDKEASSLNNSKVGDFLWNQMERSMDGIEASVEEFVRYAMLDEAKEEEVCVQQQQANMNKETMNSADGCPDPPTTENSDIRSAKSPAQENAAAEEVVIAVDNNITHPTTNELTPLPNAVMKEAKVRERVSVLISNINNAGNNIKEETRAKDQEEEDSAASLFASLTKPAPASDEMSTEEIMTITGLSTASTGRSPPNNNIASCHEDLAVQLFADLTKPAPVMDEHSVTATYAPPAPSPDFVRYGNRKSKNNRSAVVTTATMPEPPSLRLPKNKDKHPTLAAAAPVVAIPRKPNNNKSGVADAYLLATRHKSHSDTSEVSYKKKKEPMLKAQEMAHPTSSTATPNNKNTKKESKPNAWASFGFDPFENSSRGDTFENIPFLDTLPAIAVGDTNDKNSSKITPPGWICKEEHHNGHGDCDVSMSTMSASIVTTEAAHREHLLAVTAGTNTSNSILEESIAGPVKGVVTQVKPKGTVSKTAGAPTCLRTFTDDPDITEAQSNGPELIALTGLNDSKDVVGIVAQGTNNSFDALDRQSAISSVTYDITAQHEGGLRNFCNVIATPSSKEKKQQVKKNNNVNKDETKEDPVTGVCSLGNGSDEDFSSRFIAFVTAITDDISKLGSSFTNHVVESVECLQVPEDDVQSVLDVLSRNTGGGDGVDLNTTTFSTVQTSKSL